MVCDRPYYNCQAPPIHGSSNLKTAVMTQIIIQIINHKEGGQKAHPLLFILEKSKLYRTFATTLYIEDWCVTLLASHTNSVNV
jgi:hypothetical protein